VTVAVYLPLFLPGLLMLVARSSGNATRPEAVARVLAGCAAVTALFSTGSLGLLALTLLDDLPDLEARERGAGYLLPEPVPGPVALVAAALLAWISRRWWRAERDRRDAARALRTAGVPHDGLLVADWSEPHAVAVPGIGGRDGYVLLTSGLLQMLDPMERAAVLAHEHAHLRRSHHRTVAFATVAGAANPLLRPVVPAVTLLVERSADEDAAVAVGDRHLVARTIAKVVLAAGTHPPNTLGARGSNTLARVGALTGSASSKPWSRICLGATIALAAGVFGGMALIDFVHVAYAWLSAP
jgi:Zn-dependent protease with chaperone function